MDAHIDIQQPQWEDLALSPAEREAVVAPAPVQTAVQVPVPSPRPAPAAQPQLPAAYLTHELRAPVTAIRLGLEILQEQIEGRLQPSEQQMLSVAVRNTARLETLVNDIMDYSKVVAGKLSIEKTPCEPRGLIRDAADGLRATALAQGVKLVLADGEPLPRIAAEPRRIVQILTNLISNGIKFTPARGRVTISAELGKREHEGTVLFKVKDTGRGIPAQDLEKIFDMFTRCSNVTEVEGTGLGLTLARQMVQLHGGRIWADSWRGVGATFLFTIPIVAEDLGRPIKVYPREREFSGLLVNLAKHLNAFLALFV